MSKKNKTSIVDETINRLNELSPKLPDKRKGSLRRFFYPIPIFFGSSVCIEKEKRQEKCTDYVPDGQNSLP